MPTAAFLENNEGNLGEQAITKEDIQSSIQIAKSNIESPINEISKAIYLRRFIEITEGHTEAWHLLSNLLHKRRTPTIGENEMSVVQISTATTRIISDIENFDYQRICTFACDNANLISIYDAAQSNYEKLQIYRMIFGTSDEDHIMRKFINETYHVENDYLFQLNPVRYNTIPNYIIVECDRAVDGIRGRG